LSIVADTNYAFSNFGKGDVISSDEGILSVSSGSIFALAAAGGLFNHTKLTANEIAIEPLKIASEICVYTNSAIILEEI
jgi:ATP-dependent HslUV protease, peptidase subunit HslV